MGRQRILGPGCPAAWFAGILLVAACMAADSKRLAAAEQPSNAASYAQTSRILKGAPISLETWPQWRDHYLAMFYQPLRGVDDRTFSQRVQTFVLGVAAKPGSPELKMLEADPVFWVALACSYLSDDSDPRHLGQAEKACRRGIELGDLQATASYALAFVLLDQADRQRAHGSQPGEYANKLREVEGRLSRVQAKAPQARLSFPQARLAALHGRKDLANRLFGRATEEDPLNDVKAVWYLFSSLAGPELPLPVASLTQPFVKRFPDDPRIKAANAIALYRDERFPEAADALQQAIRQDPLVTRMIGDQAVQAIEQARSLNPKIVEGTKALREQRYDVAIARFREACGPGVPNAEAAHLLAAALLGRIEAPLYHSEQRKAASDALSEISGLCKRLPRDGDLQAAYAVALFNDGKFSEAQNALRRAEELGAKPATLIQPSSLAAIRAGRPVARAWHPGIQRPADSDTQDISRAALVVLGFFGAWAAWIAIMFAMGTLLAIAIPRRPTVASADEYTRSLREIWLERFYLVVLGLSLLVFYLFVPFVALGLLSVTLAIFGAMLVARIVYVGALYRGFWATWGIVRCAFLGPGENLLRTPVTEVEHPRLFEASREVADRLNTDAADAIYLTPTSQIGVLQRGAGPFGLFGKRTRVLEIGIATMPMLTISELKSILAHEYGHFTHRDPFFGRFIFQVSGSLAVSMSVMSAAAGALNYINPFYWFYWMHLKAFNLLSAGFSRSREFLADRRAAIAYGKSAFIGGLTKVMVDGGLYEATAYQNVRWLLSNQQMFTNVFEAYRGWRQTEDLVQKRHSLLQAAHRGKTSWFDTHPNFAERLAAVEQFPDERTAPETESAATLLTDANAIEATLTNLLTACLAQAPARSG